MGAQFFRAGSGNGPFGFGEFSNPKGLSPKRIEKPQAQPTELELCRDQEGGRDADLKPWWSSPSSGGGGWRRVPLCFVWLALEGGKGTPGH